MKNPTLLLAFACAAAATGCFGFEHKSTVTAPSSTGISALMGSWTSGAIVPTAATCSDFQWDVTEQTGTAARGNFSATCAGDLRVQGTAQATLNGSAIDWTAQGTASAPGLPSCAISLAGTAQLDVDSMRIPYSGDTCLGKVSGTEVLHKK
jgi:hypothetical protein